MNEDRDWKLKLKFGKLKTPYKHITVLADGVVGDLKDGFECNSSRAWMTMKSWATDYDQAQDMIEYIGRQIGFKVDGSIECYDTDPSEPPRDNPYAYDISFSGYEE